MSKKWLLFIGIVLILQMASSHSLPEHVRPAAGAGSSLLQGLGAGQPDITYGTGNIRGRRAAISDAGSNSETSVAQTEGSSSPTSSFSDTLQSLALVPLNLLGRIIALPLTIIGNAIGWSMDSILNLMQEAAIRAWKICKTYIIPQLDKLSLKLAISEYTPQQLKTMFMTFHSTYVFMKLFGYMAPS